MATRQKDLDRLKKMTASQLRREEKKAWATLQEFFNGKVNGKDAREAKVIIKNLLRVRELEIRARRKQLRDVMG